MMEWLPCLALLLVAALAFMYLVACSHANDDFECRITERDVFRPADTITPASDKGSEQRAAEPVRRDAASLRVVTGGRA